MFQFESVQREAEVVATAAAWRAARHWVRLIEVTRDGGAAQVREQQGPDGTVGDKAGSGASTS
jgi:hypothetical protein